MLFGVGFWGSPGCSGIGVPLDTPWGLSGRGSPHRTTPELLGQYLAPGRPKECPEQSQQQ
eukprot:605478-Pyramimonas_sp.AAC.1